MICLLCITHFFCLEAAQECKPKDEQGMFQTSLTVRSEGSTGF